jgi:hypothetical protein
MSCCNGSLHGLDDLIMNRQSISLIGLLTLCLLALTPVVARADPLDFDLPRGGHFYKQANGLGGQGNTGYTITDDDAIPFWDGYQRLGGTQALGYPASHRFISDGFTVQVMQKVVFQWHPQPESAIMFLNVLDLMHDQGLDDWLLVYRMTPRPFDTQPDTGLAWNAVVARHLAFLDTNLVIKARYFADPRYIDHYGLPMSYADMDIAFIVRAQRVVFQYWKEDVPWARKGEVTIANGGDLLKEAGLVTGLAVRPAPPSSVSHDWRAPGFVSAVGGKLYDPRCVPLVSVSINVPNLLFRAADNTLAYLRDRRLRWIRVFATGHGATVGPNGPPQNVDTVVAALRAFLAQVEQFNRANAPDQSIFVLVSLTDYNDRGVPGDAYASDNPTWSGSVLPAPWFRAGVPRFDFVQEYGQPRLTNAPNYEVNYKPWVERIVESAKNSPALLGWQLGNELKARGSSANKISSDQAYMWYLAFTRDMVDTIRARDRSHLLWMGAQYMAELTDWPYRPYDPAHPDADAPNADLLPKYRELVQRMLDACGQYCWNVWDVNIYDFNSYPLDDAALFAQARVATVAIEYGLNRPAPGDLAALVQNGDNRPWIDLDGHSQPGHGGALALFDTAPLAGIAPWGSPVPGFASTYDVDGKSGITGTPEEERLWATWATIATQREQANRLAGPSNTCLAAQGDGR